MFCPLCDEKMTEIDPKTEEGEILLSRGIKFECSKHSVFRTGREVLEKTEEEVVDTEVSEAEYGAKEPGQ